MVHNAIYIRTILSCSKVFNPFHATGIFLYLWKHQETSVVCFSYVFRGCRIRSVAWNELRKYNLVVREQQVEVRRYNQARVGSYEFDSSKSHITDGKSLWPQCGYIISSPQYGGMILKPLTEALVWVNLNGELSLFSRAKLIKLKV